MSGFSGEKGGLFSGLVFTTSRIGGDDLSSVWALVTYHKGKFIKHFTQRCTHLLTNETDSKKYFAAKKYLIPTICVDWLTDSIKAGKLLNVESYHPITKGRYGKGFPLVHHPHRFPMCPSNVQHQPHLLFRQERPNQKLQLQFLQLQQLLQLSVQFELVKLK